MLTLDNFETQIASVIVQRGRSYYKNGNVISIEETDDNTWTAEVEGTDLYTVEVTLKNKTITDYSCDCPYDGVTCKHVVAVLFTLRGEVGDKKKKGERDKKKKVFETILQSISLKESQDFIRSYAGKHKDFKSAFELFFADKDPGTDIEQKYTDLTNKIIDKYSYGGYIDYDSSNIVAREIIKLLDAGFKYVEKKNFKDAFALVKGVLKPLMEAILDAEDSGESLVDSTTVAINLLKDIAKAGTTAIPVKEDIFQFLLKELNDEKYFDYGDLGDDLFDILQSLAVQLKHADAFLQFIDDKIKRLKDEYGYYDRQHLIASKIKFLKQIGKSSEAEKLIQANMNIVEVRQAAVNAAIKKKDYAGAKKLVTEGIRIAEREKHEFDVDLWKEVLLKIAEKENDTETIRKYARYFALDSDFSEEYYKIWKKTYPPEEWKEVIDKYIEETLQKIAKQKGRTGWDYTELSEQDELTPIYIQEQYWDRLLAFLEKEKDLDITLEFHRYLVKSYPEDLMDIYLPALEKYGMNANDRSGYADLVYKMQKIMKDIPKGKERILALAQKLKAQFSTKPRRPAMIEELNKILK